MIERAMAKFLKARGWVVFYLDEPARECRGEDFCWLRLYQDEERRKEIARLNAQLPPVLRSR